MVAELDHETWKTLHHKAVILGGECTLVAVTLSAYLLASHFASYHRPEEQKWVVAIIFMVPIYALDSWLSLISVENSLFFNMARDCYEAYAIYAFGCYLVSCLGAHASAVFSYEWSSVCSSMTGCPCVHPPVVVHMEC
eukprot:jgi/Mesvir1/22227/Mv13039-RA.1